MKRANGLQASWLVWMGATHRYPENLVTLVRVSWPVLVWLTITVLVCAGNPAMQSIWATLKTSSIVIIPQTHRWAAALGLIALAACFFIGAKASLDGARHRTPDDPALKSLSTILPFLAVTLLVFCLVVASARMTIGVWEVVLITAVYVLYRVGVLIRWLDEPGSLTVALCGSCVLLALMAINPKLVPAFGLVGFLILMSELLIWRSNCRSTGARWWEVLIWLSLGWLGIDRLHIVFPDQIGMWPVFVLYAGLAGFYVARSWSGLHRTVAFFISGLVFLLGLALFEIMQAVSFHGDRLPVYFGIGTLFAALLATRGCGDAWRARTYGLIAIGCLVAVLAISVAIATQGRPFTAAIGTIAFAMIACGLWGLLTLLSFVYLPRRTGQVRWSISLLLLVVIGQAYAPTTKPVLPTNSGIDSRTDFESFVRSRVDGKGAQDYYIVAAAGGGLRAASHTAQVLEELDMESCGVFHERLLAISSVSGGSLGATAYLLSPDRGKASNDCKHSENRTPLQRGSSAPRPDHGNDALSIRFVRRDYVSNTLANFLFPSVVHGLMPWVFRGVDRGGALQSDWEDSWAELTKEEPWSTALLRSRLAGPDQPALLLNTTSVITGERLVVSTKRYRSELFRDLFDLGESYRGIKISEAVLNSARFPVISPAARIVTSAPDLLGGWSATKALNESSLGRVSPSTMAAGSQLMAHYLSATPRTADYLVDGGYFENSGAETLLELVPKILALLPAGAKLHAIVINNAPARPGELACDRFPKGFDAQDLRVGVPGNPDVTRLVRVALTDNVRPFANDMSSGDGIKPPLNAFLNVREARGRMAVKQLTQLLTCDHVDESYFLDVPSFPSPPLTWFMDGDMHFRLQMSSEQLVRRMKKSSPALWDAIPEVDSKQVCSESKPGNSKCE